MNSVIINAEIEEYIGRTVTFHHFKALHTTPEGATFRFELIVEEPKAARLLACMPIAKNVEIVGHLDAYMVVAEHIKLVLPNLTAADADPVTIPL